MQTKIKSIYAALAAVSLSFFGVGFHKAWVYACTPMFRGEVLGPFPLRTWFELCCAIAAIAFALFALQTKHDQMRNALLPIAVWCQILSAGLLAISVICSELSLLLCTLACFIGACGVISMSLLWVDVYAFLNPLRVALFYSGGILLACLINFAVQENPPLRLAILGMILPFFTVWCLKRSQLCITSEGETTGALPQKLQLLPWKALLFIAAYAFAYGVSAKVAPIAPSAIVFITMLPALIVFFSVLCSAKRFNFELIYRWAFPLMVLGFLAVAAIPNIDKGVSAALVGISYISSEMLVVLIVCGLCYRTGANAFWLFGIIKGCQYLAKFMGLILMNFIVSHEAASQVSLIAAIIVVALIVLASVIFATERSLFSKWGAKSFTIQEDNRSAEETEPLVARISDRVEGLAEVYDLTQRETEVLMLLARGKTVRGIGSDMFIAEGTVKAHIQHIYQKLGVHNRSELLKFLGVSS
ncbi:LuxR C-terminal-related transcriptional regulator [Eggerthellaceae bacterium 3-80]|nr:DNA-binding response regulator [bacterium D16-34]